MNYSFPNKITCLKAPSIRWFLLIILLTFQFPKIFSQRNISPQAQNAIDLFDNKEYSESAASFQKLLQKFPKDPLYQFYLAASLIDLNSSSNQVEDYLKFACAKNTDIRAWYYLGKNYYRQFSFDEAENAFLELKKRSTWSFNKDFSVTDEIERATKGKTFFSSAIPLNVFAEKIVSEDSIAIIFKILRSGNFQITQKELPVGKTYFFSIIKSWQKGKDIYMSRKINDTLWSEYENLGSVINTNDDEDYPVFNEATGTLYFASKGHGSVGGFDIFSSKYDSVKKIWSQPQQFPFPINTQWDDFILLQEKDNNKLVSNRENIYGKATIYTLEKTASRDRVSLKSAEEQLTACMLKINKVETKKSTNFKEPIKKQNSDTSSFISEEIILNISKALRLQRQCDSLVNRDNAIKEELNNTTDKDVRARLFSEMKKNSKLVTSLQNEANEYYSKANFTQFSLASNKKLSKKYTSPNKNFTDTLNNKGDEDGFPDGIIYRIQLGVFSKPVSENMFLKFQPLSTEYMMNGKVIKYYFGFFNQYNQADISLAKVKESGFTEAFIIAYYNNKKIPLERAKELEKLQH